MVLFLLGLACIARGIALAARRERTAPSWLSVGATLVLVAAGAASDSSGAAFLVAALVAVSAGFFAVAGQIRRERLAATNADDEAQLEGFQVDVRIDQLSRRLRSRPGVRVSPVFPDARRSNAASGMRRPPSPRPSGP